MLIMWWLSLNLLPIFNIILGITEMPHYTIVFRFLFEFVVLGAVPGTDINIDFIESLVIWLFILTFYLIYLLFKPRYKNHKLSY
jgi:hypothetical protein